MPTTVHIPPTLLKSVDHRAKALGVSRNRLIVWATVSHMYGRVKASLERRGTGIEDFDAAVAAYALAFDATLVTADRDHMTRVPGLRVENWGG